MLHITPDRRTAVVFAAAFPYPPRSGTDLRALATVHALGSSRDVGIFALASHEAQPRPGEPIVASRVSRRFASDAAVQLRSGSLRWLRHASGHPSDGWYSDGVVSELAEFLDELEAPVVVLETLWLHRYIAPLQELGCDVILNAHGVEGALAEELSLRYSTPLTRKLAASTHRVEASAFAGADQVWIPSANDAREARDRYGAGVQIEVVPNVVEVDRYGPPTRSSEHFTVTFTASFGYPPNALASRRLFATIFPALRHRVPNARLALVGRDPTSEMRAAAQQDERIRVTGAVPDIAPHLRQASAMAVPLSEGHGTRFKILEAFASGIPVVSSAKGMEGIDAETGMHYLAAESDADFVAALELLAHNPALGIELGERGLARVRSRYSFAVVRQRVSAALAAGTGGG